MKQRGGRPGREAPTLHLTTSTVSSMRRASFGYVALALAIVVVFAPRPLGGGESSRADGDGGLLIGRALAPAIDAVNIREQDSARSMREPAPAFWMVCLPALTMIGLARRAFSLIDPPSRRRLVAAVGSRGCRAPPPSLA